MCQNLIVNELTKYLVSGSFYSDLDTRESILHHKAPTFRSQDNSYCLLSLMVCYYWRAFSFRA